MINILGNESFLNGDTTTDFITRYNPPRSIEIDSNEKNFLLMATTLWLQHKNRSNAVVLGHIPSGWHNARLPYQQTSLNWMKQNSQFDTKGRETAHLLMRKIKLPSSIMSQMNLLILNLIS